MTGSSDRELSAEEREKLELVEGDTSELAALIDDLGSASRRKRQFSARVVSLLAQTDPERLVGHIPELIDGLYRPEAQTRWEILDTLTALVPIGAKEVGPAFEGAESALFDELSPALRLSAFRLLAIWGATDRGRSKKVWPILDEAIQCYHGDLEYRDMLGCLHAYASGKITGDVAEELAGRLQFDAENGKGTYIKARSREIYDMLVRRFKFEAPKRRARVKPVVEDEDEQES